MNKYLIIVPLGALLIYSVACAPLSGGDSSAGNATDSPAETQLRGEVVFADEFNDIASGWEVFEMEGGSAGYSNEAYFVKSTTKDAIMWGLSKDSFDNTIIEVDVTQVSGPENNNDSFSVGCRFDRKGIPSGYFMSISGRGYFSILTANANEDITLVDWTKSSAINQGPGATNKVKVTCNGSTLSLEVNNTELVSVLDSTYSTGYIVLAASTFEEEPTQYNFDNLTVITP